MNPAEGAMDPLRSAALTLHALDAGDRQWLLEGLSEPQRRVLLPLLEELRALGIPGDPSLLRDLHAEDGAHTPAPAWPQALGPAEVATLARVLGDEPLGLTRALLAIRDWSWAPQLLAAMDEGRRRQLQEHAPARPPAPVLQSAILQALRERCDAVPPLSQEAAPNRWQRARSRMARWRGRS